MVNLLDLKRKMFDFLEDLQNQNRQINLFVDPECRAYSMFDKKDMQKSIFSLRNSDGFLVSSKEKSFMVRWNFEVDCYLHLFFGKFNCGSQLFDKEFSTFFPDDYCELLLVGMNYLIKKEEKSL